MENAIKLSLTMGSKGLCIAMCCVVRLCMNRYRIQVEKEISSNNEGDIGMVGAPKREEQGVVTWYSHTELHDIIPISLLLT